MNILFLNTTYLCGGAEKVANQLFNGMKKRGHQVYEIVSYHKRPEKPEEGVSVLYEGRTGLALNRLLTGNHSNASLRIPYSRRQILRFIKEHKIDIVHLHNAHGNFLGIDDIRAISEHCPIVWTLHDFWAFTGHCTYPTGCSDLWKEGCFRCPQLQNYPPLRKDISGRLLEEKSLAFRTPRICYAVPSVWMERQVRQSVLADQNICCIPNSLNTALWTACDKQALREDYRLPAGKHILAFVAADPQKKLKGMDLLLSALARIPNPEQYLLLIAGREDGLETIEKRGFSIRRFGYITNQKKMNEFYGLADLLVNPSIYETFGLVNIEAMASGTPVLAFSVCAMEEIITPKSGWCLPDIDGRLLADQLSLIFQNPRLLAQKGRSARDRALCVYSEEQMFDSYETLYKKTAAG